jgi:glycosyltransferase involved in cell wall biosynthesis
LEAFAAGKPVIASPQALGGLDVIPGKEVLQAMTQSQWVNCVAALLQDNRERQRLGEAGREFIIQRHQWEKCLQPLDELLGSSKINTARPLALV